ncbi:MAG: hypothetical protein M3Z54_03180 [Gemmatimonadota bacterium]|nr:hypothetical protein [Gemmatimonadota bacterium]
MSDTLAAYEDLTVRFLSTDGGAIIWEHPDSSLDSSIDALLTAGRELVRRSEAWKTGRPNPPLRNELSIALLTPAGVRFQEGAWDALTRDTQTGAALLAASMLLRSLTAKAIP